MVVYQRVSTIINNLNIPWFTMNHPQPSVSIPFFTTWDNKSVVFGRPVRGQSGDSDFVLCALVFLLATGTGRGSRKSRWDCWDGKLREWWKVILRYDWYCTPKDGTTGTTLLGSKASFKDVVRDLCREEFIDFQGFTMFHLSGYDFFTLTGWISRRVQDVSLIFSCGLPIWGIWRPLPARIPHIRQWTNIKWVWQRGNI